MEEKQSRVLWVDTLKGIGIFTIYLAHFLDGAGFAYKFVCMYAIQLFFFVSGFFALRHIGETTAWENIRAKARHILLPYLAFSALNLAVIAIRDNLDIGNLLPMLKQTVMAIRNQLYAPALWFLPCLFVVSILFDLLHRICKKGYLTFAVTAVIYALVANFLPFDATDTPKWFFNIDSALFYLFYYALGALIYPFLKENTIKGILERLTGGKKMAAGVGIMVLTVIVTMATALTYFGRKDYFIIFPIFEKISFLTWVYPIFIAMSIIALHILLAKKLQHIPLFQAIGKNTLWLCGNENVVKILVPCTAAILGLNLQPPNPLATYLYAFLLLVFANYVMIPIEKKLFPK